MMEKIPAELLKRGDESNTETPRECYIEALFFASQNALIPADVQDAVLASAERGKDILVDLMIEVNNASKNSYSGEFNARERYLRLAAQIAFSYGTEGPEAFQRRLEHLHNGLYSKYYPEDYDITE